MDASRTRVRGQHSSRLLAAEEGESHLGNRLGLWPSTCWRRRSKAACRRASPLTAAVATRRRPRSKSCCASCPLRPSSRRCAHAAGEAAGRRGHLREEDAHLRRPLPARGRLPRPEGTMAGRCRLCRLPPLAAATGCGRWTSTWMTCLLRCSCRRSKLVSPSMLAAGGTAMQPPGLAAHFTLASDSVVSVPARWPMPPLSGASAQPERDGAAMLLIARV